MQSEDLGLCKAFIQASEDSVLGANQRSNQFKTGFFEEYKKLVVTMNERCGTFYVEQTQASAFNRFKKMSRLALKLIGRENSAGDPLSGDNDKNEWEKQVRKTFVTRNPDANNFVENVYTCKHFLQNFPKWRTAI